MADGGRGGRSIRNAVNLLLFVQQDLNRAQQHDLTLSDIYAHIIDMLHFP